MIYLDYNATTPIAPRVAEAMLPYLHQHFGNPSSSHVYGKKAHAAVEKAREQVAELLGCKAAEIVFTSGGSESNNYAIRGVVRAYRDKGNHIITSSVEHPAVSEVCAALEKDGFKVTYIPVDGEGRVNPSDVEAAITDDTILITIMYANNEVGTLEPIPEIAKIAREKGILIHTDSAQAVGKIPTKVDELGVDLLSVAGHKLYAPKGVGALYVREGVELEKLIHGAGHESGRRAGTENVMSLVGLGEAAAMAHEALPKSQEHLAALRDRLEEGLLKLHPDVRVHGSIEHRLPNTTSVGFKGLRASDVLDALRESVAGSAGSACHGEGITVSGVLQAMNVPFDYAIGTIRFSVGHETTNEEIEEALLSIKKAIAKL